MANNGERRVKRMGARGVAAGILTPIGAIGVLVVLIMGIGVGTATPVYGPAPPPAVLAVDPSIDAVAANTSTVFYQDVNNCWNIYAMAPYGGPGVYAQLPVEEGTCTEGSLAIALTYNACGCASDVLYDVVAGTLYRITDWGTVVTPLASFPVPFGVREDMGLTWDQTGNWSHDLIITSSSDGQIWLYNITLGTTTLFMKMGEYISGPAVAPYGFGSYGGDLLVGVKHHNAVDAITPLGVVSTVTSWTEATAVAFDAAPQGYGFGPYAYTLFVANFTSGALEAWTNSQLVGYNSTYNTQGWLMSGNNHGIASFTGTGASTLFASNTLRLSAIAFVAFTPSCCPSSVQGGVAHPDC